MPRKPRFNLPGIPQHVIQRGNNRQPCFFAERDYCRYLEDLKSASEKYECQIHAFVLMTNHVHLLVTPAIKHSISQMMQALGRRYVYYINKRYHRTGTLWEGRYKSSLIDSDSYFLTCMRYIELNPVRTSMVEYPGEYKWSSYNSNAQGHDDNLIQSHPLYDALAQSKNGRQHAYRELFRHFIDAKTVLEIRSALNHELVFGGLNFKNRIEQLTQRQTRLGKAGRPRSNGDTAN